MKREQARRDLIEKQLLTYVVEDTVKQTLVYRVNNQEVKQESEIRCVGDLWAAKSPYKYYPEKQDEYAKVEPDMFERPCEFLKDEHKKRWTELNQFWF